MASEETFLRAFGERVRGERARRGMSRKLLADHAGISERYITQLESGKGNASILILRQIAAALGLPLTRLVEDESPSAEMALLTQFLARLSPEQLEEGYALLASRFAADANVSRAHRVALVGLRGAGKTTIGAALARAMKVPFFELDREIERLSGTSLGSILEMYGQQAYRRYESQALHQLLEAHPRFVVATGGSIVSETATYELLLRHCFTVWIRATPEEHMARVIAQGDHRPMAGSAQAMEDLRRILEERTPLYARADAIVETSGHTINATIRTIVHAVQGGPPASSPAGTAASRRRRASGGTPLAQPPGRQRSIRRRGGREK
jgi:XRE family aerobic/anaerobic benzoate catabolism transcriptional regulator